MRALLDVNVLIALLDADHVSHAPATEWFAREGRSAWASCPITENGCVRVMAHPGYPNPLPISAVLDALANATGGSGHQFWADDLSLLDKALVDRRRIHGPKQLTDIYLLALAVQRGGRLVTFDAAIPASAVRGAESRHLEVI